MKNEIKLIEKLHLDCIEFIGNSLTHEELKTAFILPTLILDLVWRGNNDR